MPALEYWCEDFASQGFTWKERYLVTRYPSGIVRLVVVTFGNALGDESLDRVLDYRRFGVIGYVRMNTKVVPGLQLDAVLADLTRYRVSARQQLLAFARGQPIS